MILPALFFYLFAGVCVASAVMVVVSRNPVHSVLYLILAFVNASALFVLMGAEFLAMILVIVYVGAVAVLFLFVVMMLDVNFDKLRERFRNYIPVGATVGLLILFEMSVAVIGGYLAPNTAPTPVAAPAGYSNTHALGMQIYTDYVYPFEIAAVILLVAIIAAIALTHRQRRESKYQDPTAQVRVRSADRLRIVHMASETRESAGEGEASPAPKADTRS